MDFLCFDLATNEPLGLLPNEAEALEEVEMFSKGPAKESIDLAKIIRDRASEKGIPYRQAFDEIRAEQPELWRRASEAVVGLKITPRQIGRGANQHTIYDYESDPAIQIKSLAKELAASEHISFRAALTEVAREHPDLARRYSEEVLGRKL